MARNDEIVRLRKEGVGPREIARRLGLTPQTVSGVLFREGLTTPTSGRGNGASAGFKAVVVAALADATWREVSRRFGVHSSTIALWRREVIG